MAQYYVFDVLSLSTDLDTLTNFWLNAGHTNPALGFPGTGDDLQLDMVPTSGTVSVHDLSSTAGGTNGGSITVSGTANGITVSSGSLLGSTGTLIAAGCTFNADPGGAISGSSICYYNASIGGDITDDGTGIYGNGAVFAGTQTWAAFPTVGGVTNFNGPVNFSGAITAGVYNSTVATPSSFSATIGVAGTVTTANFSGGGGGAVALSGNTQSIDFTSFIGTYSHANTPNQLTVTINGVTQIYLFPATSYVRQTAPAYGVYAASQGGTIPTPTNSNIKSGVVILGVTGSYTGSTPTPVDPKFVLVGNDNFVGGDPGTLTIPDGAHVLTSNGDFGVSDDLTSPTYVVVSAANVRKNTTFGPSSSLAGTCYVPTAANTAAGANVDATVGTLTIPSNGQVLTGVVYGFGGNSNTGDVVLPNYTHVLVGTFFDSQSSIEGTLTLPTASQTLTGIHYGISGTGSTGNIVLPPTSDVLSTNPGYGPSSSLTGIASGGASVQFLVIEG